MIRNKISGGALVLGAVILLSAFCCGEAYAAGITVKAGTLGAGGDLTIGWTERVNARLGFNAYSYTQKQAESFTDVGDIKFTGELKLQTIAALLDWHPWENGFRFSLGVMLNNNEMTLTGLPADKVKIGNYNSSITSAKGSLTFSQLSPYIGLLGYGNAADDESQWHFAFDLGILLHGTPDLEVKGYTENWLEQIWLDYEVDTEVAKWQKEADKYQYWPVLSVGISYTF